jgi:hypothetical protein
MTQAQNEMTVIIDEIKFFWWNFIDQDDNRQKNLYVHAYHTREDDEYIIKVYETESYCVVDDGNPLLELSISSCGIDLQQNVQATYIGREVYNILFKTKGKGIIRKYWISNLNGTVFIGVYNEGLPAFDVHIGQPAFVVHEVRLGILNYPIGKGKTTNLYVDTHIIPEYAGENDWYRSCIYCGSSSKDVICLSKLYFSSGSTTDHRGTYSKEIGRVTKLDEEVLKILKDDKVQGIIRPI